MVTMATKKQAWWPLLFSLDLGSESFKDQMCEVSSNSYVKFNCACIPLILGMATSTKFSTRVLANRNEQVLEYSLQTSCKQVPWP